jgi:hypothetical protein
MKQEQTMEERLRKEFWEIKGEHSTLDMLHIFDWWKYAIKKEIALAVQQRDKEIVDFIENQEYNFLNDELLEFAHKVQDFVKDNINLINQEGETN